MNNKTGGIVVTLAAALLCGLPGIILSCMGVIAIAGGQSPEVAADAAKWQSTMTGALAFLCGGAVFILIPMVVGFFSLRKKSSPSPAPRSYVAPAPVAPVNPTPVPVYQSAPPTVSTPQPTPMDGSAQTVYDRLMALNRPSAPYRIIDGRSENVDLIAEWKIVDARWFDVFGKANLTKVFRIHMKLDPARHEVRAMDQELNVSWRAGVPSLSYEASFFKGQKSSISFGTGYAFTENLAPGQVYKYKFNTGELKKPIQDTVAACGWTYKGIAFGKL